MSNLNEEENEIKALILEENKEDTEDIVLKEKTLENDLKDDSQKEDGKEEVESKILAEKEDDDKTESEMQNTKVIEKVVEAEVQEKNDTIEFQKNAFNGTEKIKEKSKFPKVIIFFLIICLATLAAIFTFQKVYNKETEQAYIEPERLITDIDCLENIIGVGEILEIEINNTNETTILKSSNPEIIRVEGKNIIGISEGEAIIYAVTDGLKSNELNITCEIKIEKIELSSNEIEILLGDKKEVEFKVIPENATNQHIVFDSLDYEIAAVEDGFVKGMGEGETEIIVRTVDGEHEAKCKVKVKTIKVTNVSLDDTNVNLGVGQSYIIRATISPSNATYKDIIWKSSNAGVVTVDDGKIKAISQGTATVTASSKDGKTATCTFNVTNSLPSNPIRYVSEEFNVRSGPGTQYTKLATVSRNDELEILKETDSWAKIRIKKSGVVGYTILKAYSKDKTYYIENVPYINQFDLGYPTGCEAVSAAMAARFSGYNVTSETIINNTPTDTLGKRQEVIKKEVVKEVFNKETEQMEQVIVIEEETIWVAENPFKYFVGHPSRNRKEGSYGCYAEPIAVALRNSGVPCSNISGCSVDTLYENIRNGKPVVIWCKSRGEDLVEGVTWKYPDGSGEYLELVGEHCAVLIGYDGEYIYLNDPSVGQNAKQPKGKFESNWYKLHSQAIVIN